MSRLGETVPPPNKPRRDDRKFRPCNEKPVVFGVGQVPGAEPAEVAPKDSVSRETGPTRA